MNNSYISENRVRSRNPSASPLMFESDEDSEDENCENSGNNENANDSSESFVELTKEEKIIKGLQTILLGIPPPPAFTVPQLDSREILKLWRDNHKYRVVLSPNKDKLQAVTQLEEQAKTAEWPDVTKLIHWDIYYNCSSVSEELERLSVKYKERYVGAETSSCINALYAKSPLQTASARKCMRQQAWGHSPGRRLSHLARRRKAFSSANLCSVAGNKNKDKKMIMVEIKKIGNRLKKKSSVKKTKPTPKKKVQNESSTYKRALFQSPDLLPSADGAQTPNVQKVHHSKRNLFLNSSSEKKVNENGKRERSISRRISPRKRVNRSLSFQDHQSDSQEGKVGVQTSVGQVPQTLLTLTGAHKQKMLWATTNALRDKGIGTNHELFRPCMTVLFRACQKLWVTKVASQFSGGSTSENMLTVTKQFSDFTIKGISADPTSENLVRIYNDIMRMAANKWNEKERGLTCKVPDQNFPKTCVSERNIVGKSTTNNDSSKTCKYPDNNVSTGLPSHVAVNSIKDNLLKSQEKINSKERPSKFTDTQKHIIHSPERASSPAQYVVERTVVTENSKKTCTPKRRNKLSQNKSSECTSPLTCTNKLPVDMRSKFDFVDKYTNQSPNRLGPEHLCEDTSEVQSTNHQSFISKLSESSKKYTKVSNIIHQPIETTRRNPKKSLFQKLDGPESPLDSNDDNGLEKNKENFSAVVRLPTEVNQTTVEGERSTSSHRLFSSVENTPYSQIEQSEPKNRTLQLYYLSLSGGENTEVSSQDTLPGLEPPKLTVHWETDVSHKSQLSPPILIPHWKQSDADNAPLPDSIMTHWQQISANSINNSDKIMIDFEDTSYEVHFSPSNEDDTRASSICVPFEFPYLVDDSKSCFASGFVSNYSNDSSSNS